MGKGQRYTEKFRGETVRQVTERGFGVKVVGSTPSSFIGGSSSTLKT
jgi:hypothetical protein